jgi:amino-acid N-acetyltransferase
VIEIREIWDEDRPAVVGLLDANRLPRAGLTQATTRLWVAREDGRVVGVAGLERYGEVALLRSVATARDRQGKGIARSLCGVVLADARSSGVRRAFLLTEKAEGFFSKIGFESLDRSEADPRLLASAEFQTNQCATAKLMARSL